MQFINLKILDLEKKVLLVVLSLPCYCSGLLLLTLSPLCWMVFSLPTCSKLHLPFSVQFTGYPFHATFLGHPWDILWHFIFTSCLFVLSFIHLFSMYIYPWVRHTKELKVSTWWLLHVRGPHSSALFPFSSAHDLHPLDSIRIAHTVAVNARESSLTAIPAIRWISFELFC